MMNPPSIQQCPPDHQQEYPLGELSVLYAGGDLRYIRVGGCELLRRVYVAVRDAAWNTVPGRISDLAIERSGERLWISYRCEHRDGPIDFAWDARIDAHVTMRDGVLDARLTFSMSGAARSPFRTNRTGFCVLHPIAECAGRTCTIEHANGMVEQACFPQLVAPHQPFSDIRAMVHEAAPGLRVEVRFEGETFETEDQRNWTDGSFKTYCRPLALPFPYELKPGDVVRQTIIVKVTGPLPREAGTRHTITIGDRVGTVPRIGLQASPTPMSDVQIRRLRALRLSHLRVDVRAANALPSADLMDLQLPLEVAVHLPQDDDDASVVARLLRLWAGAHPEVARLIVYRDRQPASKAEDVQRVRRTLGLGAAALPVGGGTIGSFAELNRNRPPAGAMDVLAFPVNPQIHASDDLSLIENLQGQADPVRTARLFGPRVPLAVGPIMLHRRPDPFAAGKSGQADEVNADPRQKTLFGAVWTLGSIKQLAEAGADSLTSYETTGPFGVMDEQRVFPLYHVLADIGEFAGGEVLATHSGAPLVVQMLALRNKGRRRYLIANLTARPQEVYISGLVQRASVRHLNETNVSRAMAEPEAYRAEPPQFLTTVNGELRLGLLPYAIARLDDNSNHEHQENAP